MPAPIALFVYNRPWHARKCLESLANNPLAVKSILYIYVDGPRADATEEELKRINEVNELINERKWCGEVHIIKSKRNVGIGTSVINGITEVLKHHNKIIVLEDDLVLSGGFLKYMNAALDLYEHESKVMHVSGYSLPVKAKLPETFFHNFTTSWGWGTWTRAWNNFSSDSGFLWQELASRNLLDKFSIDHTIDYDRLLLRNKATEEQYSDIHVARNSSNWNWDVCWNASVCLAGGYSLHPFPSLVKNIGHDEMGVHCKKGWWSEIYNNQEITTTVQVKKIPVEKSMIAWNAIKKFNRIKPGLLIKIKEKLQVIFAKKE